MRQERQKATGGALLLLRLFLFFVVLFNGIGHAVEAGFYYRAGHCEVKPDITFGVADKQRIAALEQHTDFVCEEVRHIQFDYEAQAGNVQCTVKRLQYQSFIERICFNE